MAIYKTDCPHCATNDVGFTVVSSYPYDASNVMATAACGRCRGPIVMKVATNSPVERLDGDLEGNFYIAQTWPSIEELEAPAHTPGSVANRYIEGEDSFRRARWNSAVAMYRSALDIATKSLEGVPQGLTFYKRLNWLHEHHFITPQMKDWADHVRVEGNEALHDPEDFTEADARPLRLFTETFLRYVYELPGEVAAYRGQSPAA